MIGLSRLLTLAFDSMKKTSDAIKESGLRDQVKIVIGESSIDDRVRRHAGADAYGHDAMAAVTYAKSSVRGAFSEKWTYQQNRLMEIDGLNPWVLTYDMLSDRIPVSAKKSYDLVLICSWRYDYE